MKKQLLKETEIRKMMKFANIGALTDGFVERLNETYETDEPVEEGYEDNIMEQPEDVLDMDAAPDEEPAGEDEFADVDVEEPVEEGGEMELSEEEAQVIIDLGNRLEGAMPEEGEEVEGDEELPMPDEEGMELGGEEEEEEMPPMMEEDLVNEVARRVSRRIAALRG